MPPKKIGKKSSADLAKQLGEDKLKLAESEVVALQRQLQMLKIEHKEARELEQSWRHKVAHYEAVLARKEQDMADITKSMARKSTAIQDQKQAMIEDLEEKVQQLTRDNAALETARTKAEHATEAAAVEHQTQVENLQKRVQGMHLEYSQMLHQSLAKLQEEALAPYIDEAKRNVGVRIAK
eukprot:jgi/Ulvmu1/8418/UM042_0125.1